MTTDTQSAINLVNVESLINSTNSRFDTLTKEYREQKSMLDAILDNDLEYKEALMASQKASKLKNLAKQKVLQKPESTQLVDKIKDYQSQLKELKVALSDYLSQYVTLSGTNQIEGPDGVLHQIIYTAKLVKSK
jgi:chromosome segregation ATPase